MSRKELKRCRLFVLKQHSLTRISDIVMKFNLLFRVGGHEFPHFFVSIDTTFNVSHHKASSRCVQTVVTLITSSLGLMVLVVLLAGDVRGSCARKRLSKCRRL